MRKRTRQEFEPRGVDAVAYLDTVRIVPLLQREIASIGITVNAKQTAALPPKRHMPTPEEIALLGGIDVRIADRGGVTVAGVSIRTDAYAMESTMEITGKGGAERLA